MSIHEDDQADAGAAPDAWAPTSRTPVESLPKRGLFGSGGSGGSGARWTAMAVVAVLVIAVGLLSWNWYQSSQAKDDATASAPNNPGAVLMTADQLKVVVAKAGHSVYWAGPRGLSLFEVTIVNRDIYVRYLPADVPAGSNSAFLTVGTYEKADAYAGLVKSAGVSGAKSQKLAGGALLVQPSGNQKSAYFAFQGANLLMEVFDPTPGAAYALVMSGAVQPIQ